MPHPLRIAVVGAGAHAREHHLPALAQLRRERPGELASVSVFDLDADRARTAAAAHDFEAVAGDLEPWLDRHPPAAALVLTPPAATAGVALRLLARGIPLLIEKPPGATPDEARAIQAAADSAGAPVMVSLNRRYDPVLAAGLAWVAGRPIRRARGAMYRVRRREPRFLLETGLHALDALAHLAGPFSGARCRKIPGDGADWLAVEIVFAAGAAGALELFPTAGVSMERYELTGEGWRVEMRSAWLDDGRLRCWEGGELVRDEKPAAGRPVHVRSGAQAETEAFVDALQGRRAFYPTIRDTLPGMELLHAALTSRGGAER